MKAIAALLLLALAAAVLARPSDPDNSRSVNWNLDRYPPLVLPATPPPPPPKTFSAEPAESRVRRSPRDNGRRGSVDLSVHREPGRGAVARAEGTGTLWSSNDGRARVEGYGQWSKSIDGPGPRKPNYEGGVRFSYDLGRPRG